MNIYWNGSAGKPTSNPVSVIPIITHAQMKEGCKSDHMSLMVPNPSSEASLRNDNKDQSRKTMHSSALC